MTDYPAAPPPAAAPAPVPGASYPGKTLGIVGLVLAIFFSLIGLIVSLVARSQSKKAGFSNTPAVVGIVIGILTTLGTIISIVLIVIAATAGVNLVNNACAGHSSGDVVTIGSGSSATTVACP